MIALYINGRQESVAAGSSVADLLRQLAADEAVVVAVNEQFVPRNLHREQLLQAGDQVELLSPMEGG
ncbi:sulfur carrier protein ThiS [Kineobactrum salinum]|uniref:Sulfur carrier protein ThiS n=1 Tax=Kineobactrum salinum TaxID=2708301 RepID=A0A6C0U0B3_9GAMM|nr:sulfur carrier protein ThiS [Kineobactrum salinum]QIB65348.1 sulfur carrier protein ThiS [Kineobactrum salinum]